MKKALGILLILTSVNFAQSAGKSGMAFLKNGFGARNIAMGDLGVTSAKDVTALNYNPALLTNYKSAQVSVTHNEWINDVKSEMIGASFKMFNLPFALGLNTTSISDIEIRTKPGEAESTFNAHYFFGSLSTGFHIVDDLSFGVTFKYLYEGLFTDAATGYGFDFGLSYNTAIEGLIFGGTIRNLGSMNELRAEATKLPVDLRFGGEYTFNVEDINSDITVLSGFQKYLETDDTHIHFGAEILYDKLIAVRAGFMTGYESKGLTAGLGVIWDNVNFDYAFTPFDYGLGSTHTISVAYTF
ncbi:MAG: PorV/PorQ family protein [Ignavibacteriae bacterium]|nr:hypothetical protein [Ignavibacteriota bacterium]NOG97401.1 PorV/PorQ family protein [Ignavibacteriota bacterium]